MKLSKETLTQIKQKIKKLVKNGESEEHALSLICDANNLDIKDVESQIKIDGMYKEPQYKDIKYGEGSYIMLKKKPGKQYEVININNKDAIVVRDLDDNSELTVSEQDIIPIVTESKMEKKLNEAQYTVSIDNLETTDAETLSQMLSLAGQAEGTADLPAEEPVGEPIPGADLPPMEPVVTDTEVTEFEPTIPSEMDGPGFEAAEIDSMEEPYVDDNDKLPPPDDSVAIDDEEITDESAGVEENPYRTKSDIGSQVKASMWGSPVEGMMESAEEEYEPETDDGKEILTEEDPEDEYDEDNEGANSDNSIKTYLFNMIGENGYDDSECCYAIFDCMKPESQKRFLEKNDYEDIGYAYDVDRDLACNIIEDMDSEELAKCKEWLDDYRKKYDMDESADIDTQIAETLRLAGVQLDEVSDEVALAGKKDLPTVAVCPNANPTKKDQNGFEPGENQRPDESEHRIEDISGADGFQQSRTDDRPAPGSIHVECMVSKDRINAICETATRMYAKKDKSEWLALDRRYVEKLIKEGVGYSRASKLILKAKQGK